MSHLFLVVALKNCHVFFFVKGWTKAKVVFDLDLGEPLMGETPEDFQDLEGRFMTQAIVASYLLLKWPLVS